MKDLVQRHRGELREISGEWQWQWTPFPEDRPEFFHHQFSYTKSIPFSGKGGKQKASQGKGGKVAAGTSATQPDNSVVMRDWADPQSHWLRVAKVFGLADLFCALGDTFTAKLLYMYYTSTRIIVYKRPHGRSDPVRVEAALDLGVDCSFWMTDVPLPPAAIAWRWLAPGSHHASYNWSRCSWYVLS